jgi:hypothetical protein
VFAVQWTCKFLIGILACAVVSCRGKRSGGFVSGQETIVTIPGTPIPPVPTTGSFLTGVLLDGAGSALENASLKVDATGFQTETKTNGEFAIPVTQINSKTIAVNINAKDKLVIADVDIPEELVKPINQARADAGAPPLEGEPASKPADKLPDGSAPVTVFKKKIALQIPENVGGIRNPDDVVNIVPEKQKIIVASLPNSDSLNGKKIAMWTQVDNESTVGTTRFSWSNSFQTLANVKIIFSPSQSELSNWDGIAEMIPVWPGAAAGANIIGDFSGCTDTIFRTFASGILTSADGGKCGILNTGFPFNSSADVFVRISGESDSEIKLSTVFRIASNNTPPAVSVGQSAYSFESGKTSPGIDVNLTDAETPNIGCANALTVLSTDTSVIANAGIMISGTAPSCKIFVTPAAGRTGTTQIKITANDGSMSGTANFQANIVAVGGLPPTAPTLNPTNVSGLKALLTGTCDNTATTHAATTTVGKVRSISCNAGVLSVVVHLPAGSASFDVTATSTNANGSSDSSAMTFTRTPFTCPEGYVGVPGSGIPGLGNSNASNGNSIWWLNTALDFCVMKYPAKNNNASTYATSSATGTPWVGVNRDASLAACSSTPTVNGAFRLVSNTQWQTVARNAENVSANWSGGAVGSGMLARGHSDSAPYGTLGNSTDNDDPYFGTGNSANEPLGSGWEQRRTHTLTNGEVVWDFGGNVWQWVSDNHVDLGTNPAITVCSVEFSNQSFFNTGGINRLLFAPSQLFDSNQNVGKVCGGTASGVRRGGVWTDGNHAGLFMAVLVSNVIDAAPGLGFRCTYSPASPPAAPTLTTSNVTGLSPTLTGTCDSAASSHTATTSVGSVQKVSCNAGVLSVLIHLPAGSTPFSVSVTSTNQTGSSTSGDTQISRTSFTCPAGYVGVPASGIAQLGNGSASSGNAKWWLDISRDFCVMKYPAKNNNSSTYATSTVGGTPWVSIPRGVDEASAGSALQACKDAGTGYRLISNTQWQTVARNAETVAVNWSSGSVGNGSMARGHSDNSPPNALANGADTDPYFGTGNTPGQNVGSGWEQRRTQTLTNGEVVWDFGGNIWQYVSDNMTELLLNPTIPAGGWEFSDTNYFPLGGINRLIFASTGQYSSANNVGIGGGGSGGIVQRGAAWADFANSGIFTSDLIRNSSSAFTFMGFRCAYLPP